MEGQKECKIMNLVLIICFALIIVVPLMGINRVEGKVSTVENKALTVKPNLFMVDGTINGNYLKEFEGWIDDNIGCRDSAMVANLVLKYKLFHVLDLENWHIGEDGEQFYTTGGEEIKTYTGENVFTPEDMQEMAENLIRMNRYFEEAGCTTYNIFIPNKEAVYSEMYSPFIAFHEDESRQDKFCDYLAANTDLNVMNLKKPLIEAAKEQRVYYKAYDASHWNMNGAFLGYRELMNEMNKNYPDIKVLAAGDFDLKEEQWEGLSSYYDSVPALKNSFHYKDTIYHYTLKGGWNYSVEQTPPKGMEIDPNLNYYHYSNELTGNQHCMLIVGDSYMYSFMLPFLAESVHDVYFIRNTNAGTIVKLAETVCPDVFVYEVAERVGAKAYYDCMADYKLYSLSGIDLGQAVFNSMDALFYIDSPIIEDGVLDTNGGNVEILGWGFDTIYDKPPRAIVCDVDGLYVEAEFYYRQDLDDWDAKYANCGFQIKLNKDIIGEAQKLIFYVVAEDGSVYNGQEATIR